MTTLKHDIIKTELEEFGALLATDSHLFEEVSADIVLTYLRFFMRWFID